MAANENRGEAQREPKIEPNRVLDQSLGRMLVASIGPVCRAALRKFAVRVDIEAKPPKLGPLIEAINAALSDRRPLSKSYRLEIRRKTPAEVIEITGNGIRNWYN